MIICSQSSKLPSMGLCSYSHFIKALKSKENFMILLLYPLFKLVFFLLSKKIIGYQAIHLFHLLFSCFVSQVTGGCSKQERACHLKSLTHWPPLYFSFIGWRFFQPRVSARKPLQQLGYTPTILVHSAILTSSTRKRLLSAWKFVQ